MAYDTPLRRYAAFAESNDGSGPREFKLMGKDVVRRSLFRIAHDYATREGINLEEALWNVLKAMMASALKGDSTAAKLLFERLALPEPQQVEVSHAIDTMPPEERAKRVKALLEAAEIRKLSE